MLSDEQGAEIRAYRHRVRRDGCWGGCFEVSCFIERHFGWRRRDGVYQLADGTPVFKHAWNETVDGGILDGTADQFAQGEDIACHAAGSAALRRYRDRYSQAHNPQRTAWLSGQPYLGLPDRAFWQQRYEARRLGPGWWLDDNADYLRWLLNGARLYPTFAAKVDEYRSLGYGL
ncbi:hypothetical protein LXM94_24325 [Rhizobium sp. TRM95111]|uniref:hypothetical protein n=1 Tax=Rhizobium alarense TaxID=2846851 RepID=UPI001F33FD64|nr:hypothetical protein [Rhizobium alarense]MCF3643091.1 hypothetical protein [Rhizobium alarense]